MTYHLPSDKYNPPLEGYKKSENESYVPFYPFARKTRYQMSGARGRFFPASGQMDLLDDAYAETEEVAMHETGHARNPNASESDIRQNTKNKLKNPIWH